MTVQRALTRRHWLAIGSYLLVVALTAGLGMAGSEVLSAVRAYVAGESRWSKAQSEAVQALHRYAASGEADDHLRFTAALSVPLADRQARLALQQPEPDRSLARAALIKGLNHPDDVDMMVRFFLRFREVPVMAAAIATWAEADDAMEQLARLGAQVHVQRQRGAAGTPELRASMQRLAELDLQLTALERRFSDQLGEAARQTRRLVTLATLGLTALLALGGLALIVSLLRRQAVDARALRESDERWALAAAAADLGVVDCDLEGDVIRLDACAATLSGLAPRPVRLTSAELAAHWGCGDEAPRVRGALQQAVAGGQPVVLRFSPAVLTEKAGRLLELRALMQPDGGARRLVGVLRDVSQDAEAERLRLDKEAAERADRAKGEFLSRVSHELRTPLNAVLGFGQLMQTDAERPLEALQAARLQRVIESARQLLALIDDILEVTSVDAQALRQAVRPVALDDALVRACVRIGPLAGSRDVRVEGPPSHARDLQVVADPARLDQVLDQVLSNAVKFNRPGGGVRIGVAVVHPDAGGPRVEVAISDDGPGLGPAQLELLFQPFNRLGAEFSKVPGSGLGLVISRQLMDLMGGQIEVRSGSDSGTTVILRLPVPGAAAQTVQAVVGPGT